MDKPCKCGHSLTSHVVFATHPDKRICFYCLYEPERCVLPLEDKDE
jgi:hypothetical protein